MNSQRTALAAALLSLASGAAAQTGWTGIGRGEIIGDSGRGAIAGRETQGFRNEIMICVESHALHILDAEIRYRDGRTQALRIRARMDAGDCGRPIALRGGNRDIASLDVAYEPASLGGARAIVEVFAR